MDFRTLIPIAPALMRPALVALAERLERADKRAEAAEQRLFVLEQRLGRLEAPRAVPGANHPPL
jgi:hypothetical protein